MPDSSQLPLPPTRPRLIGLDLDGTVLDQQGRMPDAMHEALTTVRAAGIELAFLTGRRPMTAKLALQRYDDTALLCTNSGCLLWDYPGWNQLGRRLFPLELLDETLEALAPHSLSLYHDAGQEEAGYVYFKRQCTPETVEVNQRWGRGARQISSLSELNGAQLTQLALPCSAELAFELRSRIRERFGERLLALAMRWPLVPCMALEIFHPQAHKGSALEMFAQRLGIGRKYVLAAGDDANDIAMLDWAGWSVAMPHAGPEIHAAAKASLRGEDSQQALAEYLQAVAKLPY